MGGNCKLVPSKKEVYEHTFVIDLGEGAFLHGDIHKDTVSLKTDYAAYKVATEWFGNSTGLMGSFHGSEMLARDGVFALQDPAEFGQEW